MSPQSGINNACLDLVDQSTLLAEYFREHCQKSPPIRSLSSDIGKVLMRSLVPVFVHADRFTSQ